MSAEGGVEFGPYRLSTSFLATLPLFVAYELGLSSASTRNTAELVAGRLFLLFGEHATAARLVALFAATVLALVFAYRDWSDSGGSGGSGHADPLPRLCARQLGEGMLAALALGPLLVGALSLFDLSFATMASERGVGVAAPVMGAHAPPLALAARIVGGAAWEELVFRFAAYGLLFLGTVRLVHFFGPSTHDAAPVGDLVALLGSSTAFAAFHLDVVTRLFGVGGEDFDSSVFLWRLLAGLALAALFRWRGLAVAAWAHGLSNGALLLGAGPGVFALG